MWSSLAVCFLVVALAVQSGLAQTTAKAPKAASNSTGAAASRSLLSGYNGGSSYKAASYGGNSYGESSYAKPESYAEPVAEYEPPAAYEPPPQPEYKPPPPKTITYPAPIKVLDCKV
ncbi:unnamed protein product, partial [Darwinula stevensoni]